MVANLKGIYIKQDDSVRALRVQQRIHAINSSDPKGLRDLGVLYLRNERPARAIELLETARDMDPDAEDVETVETLLKAARRMQVTMN